MKITIDHNYCAGCGVCCNTAPSLFYMNGYQAEAKPEGPRLLEQDELLACRLFEIAQNCPTGSLFIERDETDNRSDTHECSAQVLRFRGS
ncbi:MAG: ferredoxin [Spirochaetota bacterium]